MTRTTKTLLTALLFLHIAHSTLGFSIPKLHLGRCPDVSVVQKFTVAPYLGKWYVLGGYNTEWVAGADTRCSSAEYGQNKTAGDGVVTVHNMAIDNKTNKTEEIKGTAVLVNSTSAEAKLDVIFNVGWFGDVHGKYWVLGTDYESYSVVYSCSNVLLVHYYTVWFLSREQYLDTKAEAIFFRKTDEVLRSNKIDPAVIQKSEQVNCAVEKSDKDNTQA